MPINILLLGATGLIGSHLLKILTASENVANVYAPTRRPLPSTDKKVINPCGSDLKALLDALEAPVNVAFCCLGTTQKTAGSRAAFRHADVTLPVYGGATALRLGATHYLVVSALGANANSWFFYNRTKGEMEQQLIAQDWPHLTLARPSMLLGERKEPRTTELLAAPLFHYFPGKWKSIPAGDVAKALWLQARSSSPDALTIIESDALRAIAER
ncbi:hypothetical protein SOASR030_23040 [Leminorella grimontii]|uniref:Semialdehyde dehydrogenase NAD-binding domain-containing protein n=1 Tax=Leminorella grimontii TaxID=82981 RepID=A0AAV5N723_9GAMM|nr:hypothetical protein [Leminorella grimontii]KFC95210.1 oxidoreductase [Leminorella grimontii ATCC 33999 = DSM 5078]GKX56192.1 hypothetical protein SOASR030_23040 [Leminorella grimontii]VFS60993.1 Uncharacterised protein [Leminorella grimontii]